MADLVVEHDGQRFRFDGAKPVLIGRDAVADVVCANPAVSRRHLQVSLEGGRWMIADESRLGTFVDEERISRRALDRPVTLHLGDAVDGASVRLSVDDPFARPMRGEHETVQVSREFAERLDALQISFGGEEISVRAGEELTIGRDATNTIVVDDPIVSRSHVRIAQRGDRWVLSDVGSSGGTFVGGKRVKQYDLVGRVQVNLGDPAGPEIACSFDERKRRSHGSIKKPTSRLVLLALLISLLVGGLVLLVVRRGPDDSGLARAKQAVVWLEVTYPGQRGPTTGSGTILSKDGLILTAAHVAAKDAPGLAPSYPSGAPEAGRTRSMAPTEIVVYTYVSDDEIRKAYRASTVAVDGYLDLAVLRIDDTVDGGGVDAEKLDLPHTSLGESDKVRTGEALTVLGFPEQDQANSVTVAPETVSDTQRDLSGLVKARRFWLLGSSPRVTPGSSGGALVDESGRVLGVPIEIDPDKQQVFYRPSALAQPLVDSAKDGASGGYATYRYVKQPDPNVTADVFGASDSEACPRDQPEQVIERAAGLPYVCVRYGNMTPGQAVWVAVSQSKDGDEIGGAWQLFTPNKLAGSGSGATTWKVDIPPETLADPEIPAVWVLVYVGPSFDDLSENPVADPFPILLR